MKTRSRKITELANILIDFSQPEFLDMGAKTLKLKQIWEFISPSFQISVQVKFENSELEKLRKSNSEFTETTEFLTSPL